MIAAELIVARVFVVPLSNCSIAQEVMKSPRMWAV